MGTRDLCRMPLAAVRHGSARTSSGTGPCGDCRRVLWGTGPTGSVLVFGEIRFIEKPRVLDVGGRHVAKLSSVPRVAYPVVKVQVGDLVRVVGIVASFAGGRSVPWENSFFRAPGGKRAQ